MGSFAAPWSAPPLAPPPRRPPLPSLLVCPDFVAGDVILLHISTLSNTGLGPLVINPSELVGFDA